MEFKPFDWPTFDPLQGIYAQLGPGGTGKYLPTVLAPLSAAAISCGLDPDMGNVWAVVRQIRNKKGKPFHMALIGDTWWIRGSDWHYTFSLRDEERDEENATIRSRPVKLLGLFPENGVTIQPWHTVLRPVGSQVELHEKFHVDPSRQILSVLAHLPPEIGRLGARIGPATALLNVEFNSRMDTDIIQELDELLHHVHSRRGRPRGSTIHTKRERNIIVDRVNELRASGRYSTEEEAAAFVLQSSPEHSGRTYRRYKRTLNL